MIINEKGQAVYAMKARDVSEDGVDKKGAGKSEKSKRGKQQGSLSTEQMTSLLAELDRTGVAFEAVKERYKIPEMGDMSEELYRKVMAALSRTKSAA